MAHIWNSTDLRKPPSTAQPSIHPFNAVLELILCCPQVAPSLILTEMQWQCPSVAKSKWGQTGGNLKWAPSQHWMSESKVGQCLGASWDLLNSRYVPYFPIRSWFWAVWAQKEKFPSFRILVSRLTSTRSQAGNLSTPPPATPLPTL